MAYGQITGYKPLEDGAYEFDTQQGPMVLFGPEAEDLRSRVDASSGMSMEETPGLPPEPERLAQSQGTASAVDVLRAANQADATKLENQAVRMSGGPKAAPGVSAEQPFGEPPPPTPPPQPQSVGYGGLYRNPDGSYVVRKSVPGSAGISQEQLEERAGQGTETPVSKHISTSGGFEPDQDYLEGIADVRINERMDVEKLREIELKNAEEESKLVAQREKIAADRAKEAAAKKATAEASLKKSEDLKTYAKKTYETSRVDPGRLFAGKGGTARRFGSAIANAMGAFGAALTHTPNYAMELFEQAIADDIDAQKNDIAIKKDASDTAMADFIRQGATLEQAQILAEAAQLDWLSAQAQAARMGTANEATNAKYDMIQNAITQKALEKNEAYRQASLGKVAIDVQSQYAYPVKGSAGGIVERPATIDEVKGAQEVTAGVDGKGGKGGAGSSRVSGEIANKQANLDAALKAVRHWREVHENMGKSGVYTGTSKEAKEFKAAVKSSKAIVDSALQGNAPNESTMADIEDNMTSMSGETIRATIDEYEKRLIEKRNALEGRLENSEPNAR